MFYSFSALQDQIVQFEFRHKRKNRVHGMGERGRAEQQPPLAELLCTVHDNQRTGRVAFRHTTGKRVIRVHTYIIYMDTVRCIISVTENS